MKYLILLIFFYLSSVKGQGLNYFNYGLDSAKIQASAQNKYILIEFYADWCINCKILEDEIFSIHSLSDQINSKCINVKLDIDLFTSMDIAELYDVKLYPTILILNPDGSLILKHHGKKTYSELFTDFISLPYYSENCKF
ncbi:MAG: thioredoxin domain-containing protein [Saprospiraceae bacterium]